MFANIGKDLNTILEDAKQLTSENYLMVAFDIGFTGYRQKDEVFLVAAYTPDAQFEKCSKPSRNLNTAACYRHRVVEIAKKDKRGQFTKSSNTIFETVSEGLVLQKFIQWLQKLQSESPSNAIVLVYHCKNRCIPHMILKALLKYDLVLPFSRIVKWLVNSNDLKSRAFPKVKEYDGIAKDEDLKQVHMRYYRQEANEADKDVLFEYHRENEKEDEIEIESEVERRPYNLNDEHIEQIFTNEIEIEELEYYKDVKDVNDMAFDKEDDNRNRNEYRSGLDDEMEYFNDVEIDNEWKHDNENETMFHKYYEEIYDVMECSQADCEELENKDEQEFKYGNEEEQEDIMEYQQENEFDDDDKIEYEVECDMKCEAEHQLMQNEGKYGFQYYNEIDGEDEMKNEIEPYLNNDMVYEAIDNEIIELEYIEEADEEDEKEYNSGTEIKYKEEKMDFEMENNLDIKVEYEAKFYMEYEIIDYFKEEKVNKKSDNEDAVEDPMDDSIAVVTEETTEIGQDYDFCIETNEKYYETDTEDENSHDGEDAEEYEKYYEYNKKKKNNDKDIEGSVQLFGKPSKRAKQIYNCVLKLAKTEWNSENYLEKVFDIIMTTARGIEVYLQNEINEIVKQSRMHTFRPLILESSSKSLRMSLYFSRIILTDHGFDLPTLRLIWTEKGIFGLTVSLQSIHNMSADQKQELIEFLGDYFNANKTTAIEVI